MKKSFKIILIFILLNFISIVTVKAQSEYYKYMWTDDVGATSYVTNDVLKIDDGYVTAGFGHNGGGDIPIIRKIDENGKFIQNIELPDNAQGKIKRIIKSDNGYYAIGVDIYYVFIMQISEDLSYQNVIFINTSDDYNYDAFEVYVEEDENYLYIFSPTFSASNIVQVKKDLSSYEEIAPDELDNDMEQIIGEYNRILDLESDDYYPVFCKKYKNGYIYFLYDYETNNSTLVYYQNQKEMWRKNISNIFYRDAIECRDKLLLLSVNDDQESFITLLDEKGEEVENESIATYLAQNNQYLSPEHVIAVANGFIVTGNSSMNLEDFPVPNSPDSDDNPSFSNKALYFSYIYNVLTKTDGNGTISSSTNKAGSGESVIFTINPNKGYVLGVVKVTDVDGNTITFTSNTFTMPSADVTIEATFLPENPDTKDTALICISIIGVIALIIFIKLKYKLKFLK